MYNKTTLLIGVFLSCIVAVTNYSIYDYGVKTCSGISNITLKL